MFGRKKNNFYRYMFQKSFMPLFAMLVVISMAFLIFFRITVVREKQKDRENDQDVYKRQLVYSTGDIIDTFVYRMGILGAQFGPATAVGLFQSVVSCVLIVAGYWAAEKFAGYQVF